MFILWSSGRLQTPTEKQAETAAQLTPIMLRQSTLEKDMAELKTLLKAHDKLGGHMEMDFRVKQLEKFVDEYKRSD